MVEPVGGSAGRLDPLRGLVVVLALGVLLRPAAAAECGGERRCGCGDRVVEDYRLVEDLGPCAESGLRVAARAVVEGDGHAIRGTGARDSVGLQVAAAGSGSRVQNLEVTGFERGIRLKGAERVELVAVRAHGNGDRRARVGYGIDVADGAASNRIDRAVVYDNADEGIHVGRYARGNRITHCEVYDNGRENVYLLEGTENVLEDCLLRGGGSAAVYIKHSKGTVVARNRIADRPIVVRGASVGTQLVDNEVRGAGVTLEPYDDRKLGSVRPQRTVLRGGSIESAGVCLRLEGANDTTLEGTRLGCPVGIQLGGDSVVTVLDGPIARVRCAGRGEVRTARDVEARFVDAAGRPVPSVRIETAGEPGGELVGTTGADGVFKGRVVESVVACPAGNEGVAVRLRASGSAGARVLSAVELRGDLRLEARPPPQPGVE